MFYNAIVGNLYANLDVALIQVSNGTLCNLYVNLGVTLVHHSQWHCGWFILENIIGPITIVIRGCPMNGQIFFYFCENF